VKSVPKLSPAQLAAAEEQITADLWRRGMLADMLLDTTQMKMYRAAQSAWAKNADVGALTSLKLEELTIEALAKMPKKIAGAKCSRRIGKSSVALVISCEICLAKPGSVVKYLAKDAVDVETIVTRIMEHPKDGLLRTCPESVKPTYKPAAGVYEFKNKSRIEFYGVEDQKIEDLRGHAADFAVCDEIGSWKDPKYAIDSVVVPSIMTTGGMIYVLSTPAKTPGHGSKAIFDDLARDGLLTRFTICDSERIAPIQKVEFLVLAGETPEHALKVVKSNGRIIPKSTTARRELFVMDVTDAGSAVLPEFQDIESEVVVRVVDKLPDEPTEGYRYVVRPPYFHGYTSLDPAPTNIIALLWGYHDFERDVLVITREKFARGSETSSAGVADEVHRGEIGEWGEKKYAAGHKQPHRRTIDPDSQLEKDLRRDHGLTFVHAKKKDWDAGIRRLRTQLMAKKIEIDESCVELRRQCREATVNAKGTGFAMSSDGDHADGVSALHYTERACDRTANPFPAGWTLPKHVTDTWIPPAPPKPDAVAPATPLGKKVATWSRGTMGRLFGARR
jgi:hypothetical protein